MSKPWLAGEANGKYMGEFKCKHCGEPAKYKTRRECRKCYDAMRNRGTVEPYVKPRDYCVVCSVSEPKAIIRYVKGYGMCIKHYYRWRRDVLRGKTPPTLDQQHGDAEGRGRADDHSGGSC